MLALLLVLGLMAPLPVTFPDGYAGSADEIRLTIARAQGRTDRFAEDYGWEGLLRPVLYDSCEIYASSQAMGNRIRQLHNLPDTFQFPTGTLTGALEKRVLLFVAPDEYARMVPALARELNAYDKLMAHEIAHRLHVAILKGDEEAMGPRWFYEGFAVVASGQHEDAVLGDPAQAMQARSYREYGALVRELMKTTPLPELVQRAGKPDFEAWATALLGSARERSGRE